MPYRNGAWDNNPANPFKNGSPELEDYMNGDGAYAGDNRNGRGMKEHNVTAARSGMDEFIRTTSGAHRHRRHLFVTLSGAGVHEDVATKLSEETVASLPPRRARTMTAAG